MVKKQARHFLKLPSELNLQVVTLRMTTPTQRKQVFIRLLVEVPVSDVMKVDSICGPARLAPSTKAREVPPPTPGPLGRRVVLVERAAVTVAEVVSLHEAEVTAAEPCAEALPFSRPVQAFGVRRDRIDPCV